MVVVVGSTSVCNAIVQYVQYSTVHNTVVASDSHMSCNVLYRSGPAASQNAVACAGRGEEKKRRGWVDQVTRGAKMRVDT